MRGALVECECAGVIWDKNTLKMNIYVCIFGEFGGKKGAALAAPYMKVCVC